MLWLFRLSVDSEDPGGKEAATDQTTRLSRGAEKQTKTLSPSSCGAEIGRSAAERKGKPTYQSYSSIPIEHSSGPRAAQSEAGRRDRTAGNRVLGRRRGGEHTG